MTQVTVCRWRGYARRSTFAACLVLMLALTACTHTPINWLTDSRLTQTDRLYEASRQFKFVVDSMRDAKSQGLITQGQIDKASPYIKLTQAALHAAEDASTAGDDVTVAAKLRAVADGLAGLQPLLPKGK